MQVSLEDPPSGVVTFVFTDIEGSTRRWDADADGMRAAVAAHNDVLRGSVETHGYGFPAQRGRPIRCVRPAEISRSSEAQAAW
jgi:hypothetical protein